jgi:rubredoxin
LQTQLLSNFLAGKGCRLCAIEKRNNKNRLKPSEVISELINKYGEKIDFSKFEYNGCKVKGKCICKICGNEFFTTYESLKNGCGCPKCAIKKKQELQKIPFDIVKRIANETHSNKYDYVESKKINGRTNLHCICHCLGKDGNEHGDFWQNQYDHIRKRFGCPICKMSHLEQILKTEMDKNNIQYDVQFRDGYMSPFSFDFRIIGTNILIECQGEQHFSAISFGGIDKKKSEENFKAQIARDKSKYELAKKLGYEIIYYVDSTKFKKENRNILSETVWYHDKSLFTDINEIIEHVNKKLGKDNN